MHLTSSPGFLSLSADNMNGCKDLLTDTAKLPLSGEADTLMMCSAAELNGRRKGVEREREREMLPWLHSNTFSISLLHTAFPSVSILQIVVDYVSSRYLMTPKLLIGADSNRILPCCKHYSYTNLEIYYIKHIISTLPNLTTYTSIDLGNQFHRKLSTPDFLAITTVCYIRAVNNSGS